jgi:hypothetical protein
MNSRIKIACASLSLIVYFVAAFWLKQSYVPPVEPPGEKFELSRPFGLLDNHAFVAKAPPGFDTAANSRADESRSSIMLYENDRQLGPARSARADIANLGAGRFTDWEGRFFIFSSSDNTEPNSTGRKYWVVRSAVP